jgi:hypothetical protein
MSAAAVRFTALGICELVKSLELSELGNHIAQRLREMTTKKRLRADGKLVRLFPFMLLPMF